MICPRCKAADTRVADSRAEADGVGVRRQRACKAPACGHRFTTWETTFNAVAKRRREAARSARRLAANPEYFRAHDRARDPNRRLHAQAKSEAAETGEPLDQVLVRWGLLTSTPDSMEKARG